MIGAAQVEFNKIRCPIPTDRAGMHSVANPRRVSMRDDAPASQAPSASERPENLPFLAKLVLISLLVPAYFSVGTLAMSPSRLLFLFIVPVLTINLFRGVYGRILATDLMIFGFAAWMTLAMLVNHSPRVAIEYTGSRTIVLLGGYLTARATIRSKGAFVALIRFLAAAVLVTFPFAAYEAITGRAPVLHWLASLPGITSNADLSTDPRLGLWRAQVVFSHAIHYGIFCSLAFSLVFVGLSDRMRSFRRLVTSGFIGLSCFFSVSSGPVLAMAAQLGLIGWSIVFRRSSYRWVILWSLGIIFYIIAELATGRAAIYAIVSRISFSSSTAFARRVLFNFGVDQIGRKPLFGVGYNTWPLPRWMTGSVDNFWLFVAVRFGLPALILLAGAFLVAMILAGRRDFSVDPEIYPLRRAWIFTLVSVVLVLATVAIWGELYSLVLFTLGSGMWFLTVDPNRMATRPVVTEAEPERSSRYTRFGGTKQSRGRHSVALGENGSKGN